MAEIRYLISAIVEKTPVMTSSAVGRRAIRITNAARQAIAAKILEDG